MSVKVKRGLGLLVVAVMALAVFYVTQGNGNTALQIITLVAGLTMYAAGIVGLVLVAWGLLRD